MVLGSDAKTKKQAKAKFSSDDEDESEAAEQAAAEDSDDSDVDVVATKETPKASAKASKPAEESDDSDVDVAAAKGGAKEAAAEDSDDSDVDVVARKETAKASATASKPGEESDSSDVGVTAAKVGAKATSKAEADDDEDEDDDGEEAKETVTKKVSTEAVDNSLKVIVRGLPWNLARKTLKDDWSECGEISEVEMGQPGVAMLTFKTIEAVKKALELTGATEKYKGFKLRVLEAATVSKEGSKACNVMTYRLIQDLMKAETSGNFGQLMNLGKKISSKAHALRKAAKAQKKEKGEKKIETKADAELTVKVSKLPFELKDDGELKKFFSSKCGEVETITLKKMEDGRFKGVAIIIFSSKEAAEKAISCNGNEFAGREIRVQRFGGIQEKAENKVEGEAGKKGQKAAEAKDLKVKVSNLPFTLTDDSELEKFFSSKCGKVSSLILKKRGNGTSRGFATVILSSNEAVEKAIACNGEEFSGRKIRVARTGEDLDDEAQKTPTRNPKRKAESKNGDQKIGTPKQDASAKKKQKDAEAEDAPAKKKPRKDTEGQAESNDVEKKVGKPKQAEDTPSKKAEDPPSKKAEETPSKKKLRKDAEEKATGDASKKAEDTPSKKAEDTPSKKAEETPSKKAEETPSKKKKMSKT